MRIECLGDVVELLSVTIGDVVALENSVARARCIGYLCGVATRALEASDIESRILALEEKVG